MKISEGAEARGRYHHGDLKRALLQAARDEVAAKGAAGLSLSSLARRAGVSQSAPYRHFPDRDALLAEVAAEGFKAFADALSQASAAPGAPDGPQGTIGRMAAAYVRFGEANVELYRLMFASQVTPSAEPGGGLSVAARGSFGLLLRAVAAARPGEDPELRALAIWAQLHGLVMLKADGFLKEAPLGAIVAVLGL